MFARYLPPEYSGAAAQAFLLAGELRARGHHVEFATLSWNGKRREYVVDGFPITALAMRVRARHQEFSVWQSLAVHLWRRRHAVDILHGQGAYYTQSILGPFGRLLGKPTLVKASLSQNDLSSLSHSTIAPVHRRFLRLVDAYVAISADLKAEFAQKGLATERIWHIPNGVDTARFSPVDETERKAAADSLGLPTERPIALFVGVFDERKRIAWLLREWVARRAFGTDVHLVAVGPTSRDSYGAALKSELHALARAHPRLITVRDFSPDIARHYQAASLLLFPSLREGLPNTVLEAMACGLPCLVAQASGSRELVRDGFNGATFAVDDAAELEAALQRVLRESAALGARGRQLAVDQYRIGAIADRYEALYAHLLNERRSGG
ncbi:glycosyltransferase family 4 protein [Thiohalocapsa sp.]|jgi:glycosyltransferase involved in cell wall biosynthesis|uniref:glycosyltransferase family 4 protein n=1 Tax=Thiohalocapsa sp. TaxID=2497641 RepID=UPI0025F07880|nr:glycosyltransferase family 4 protein [Thiohalocapsa sp.]